MRADVAQSNNDGLPNIETLSQQSLGLGMPAVFEESHPHLDEGTDLFGRWHLGLPRGSLGVVGLVRLVFLPSVVEGGERFGGGNRPVVILAARLG